MEAPLSDIQAKETQQSLFRTRYNLTSRCLGKGADASIYLATDAVTKKQLVCKVVNLDELQLNHRNGRERRTRLIQETDILRQLQHPHILLYVDAFTSPHNLYTFTTLASGGDLMSFLFRHGQVTDLEAGLIMRQIVCGLGYLHSKGVVHRDLKPENVLLAHSPRPMYSRVMLADFGASAVPRRSRMVTMLGTPDYQAPEFLGNDRTHNTAADIWSLGVIAFMLVAGADADTEVLGKHRQSALNGILDHSYNKSSPPPSPNARSFIKGCLQVTSADRMKIKEAACHDWLCTPKPRRDFFRIFDLRMLSNWKLEKQLKPMPLELQSLEVAMDKAELSDDELTEDASKTSDDTAGTSSQSIKKESQVSNYFAKPETPKAETQKMEYFAKPDIPQHRVVASSLLSKITPVHQEAMGVYERFTQPVSPATSENELRVVKIPASMPPSPETPTVGESTLLHDIRDTPGAPRKPTVRPKLHSAGEPSVQLKENIFPWSVKKPLIAYKSTRRSSSRREQKIRAVKLTGHYALAPNVLDRHIPSLPGGPKREHVLQEMQKTNKKFLKNSETSTHGLSPPAKIRAQAEPNTKRLRARPE